MGIVFRGNGDERHWRKHDRGWTPEYDELPPGCRHVTTTNEVGLSSLLQL